MPPNIHLVYTEQFERHQVDTSEALRAHAVGPSPVPFAVVLPLLGTDFLDEIRLSHIDRTWVHQYEPGEALLILMRHLFRAILENTSKGPLNRRHLGHRKHPLGLADGARHQRAAMDRSLMCGVTVMHKHCYEERKS
jgi:hypothetical protein